MRRPNPKRLVHMASKLSSRYETNSFSGPLRRDRHGLRQSPRKNGNAYRAIGDLPVFGQIVILNPADEATRASDHIK